MEIWRRFRGKPQQSVEQLMERQRAEYAAKEAHDAALSTEFTEYLSTLQIEGIESISGTASGENVMYTHVQCVVNDLGMMRYKSQGAGDHSINTPHPDSVQQKKEELNSKLYYQTLKSKISEFISHKGLSVTNVIIQFDCQSLPKDPFVEVKSKVTQEVAKLPIEATEPHPGLPRDHDRPIIGFKLSIEGRKDQRL